MEYLDFLNYVSENIVEALHEYDRIFDKGENTYEATIKEVDKHNGMIMEGLLINKNGDSVSSYMYLKAYYDLYKDGDSLASILSMIVEHYNTLELEKPCGDVDCTNYDDIKDSIIMDLENYERYEKTISLGPHIRMLDLCIMFRVISGMSSKAIASTLITHEVLEQWGITLDELFSVAKENTQRLFPWEFKSLLAFEKEHASHNHEAKVDEELKELFERDMEEGYTGIYVLSNELQNHGASAICYDSLLKNIAEAKDRNLFVIPVTVHETLIVAEEKTTNVGYLHQMIDDLNQNNTEKDFLSNNVYYYNQDTDELTIHKLE